MSSQGVKWCCVCAASAESCAKTCVRLADMVQLLQDLAMEKVQANEEEGAKVSLETPHQTLQGSSLSASCKDHALVLALRMGCQPRQPPDSKLHGNNSEGFTQVADRKEQS